MRALGLVSAPPPFWTLPPPTESETLKTRDGIHESIRRCPGQMRPQRAVRAARARNAPGPVCAGARPGRDAAPPRTTRARPATPPRAHAPPSPPPAPPPRAFDARGGAKGRGGRSSRGATGRGAEASLRAGSDGALWAGAGGARPRSAPARRGITAAPPATLPPWSPPAPPVTAQRELARRARAAGLGWAPSRRLGTERGPDKEGGLGVGGWVGGGW